MILVISPLKSEFKCLVERFCQREYVVKESQTGRLPTRVFEQLDLICSIGGHGKSQFALQTQHLLQTFPKTSLVVGAGVAGSLTERLVPGDVIVGETIIEHDYQEKFENTPTPVFFSDPSSVAKIKKLNFKNLKFGKMASGDEDIVDSDRARILYQKTGADAVAWESSGLARACLFHKVPFIEIRGITDAADKNTVHDFKKNLDLAMTNVANVILEFVKSEQKCTSQL